MMKRIPRLLVSNASYRAASPALAERYGMTGVSIGVTPDVIAVSRALATAEKTGATTGRKRDAFRGHVGARVHALPKLFAEAAQL